MASAPAQAVISPACPMDEVFNRHNLERLRAAGHLLFGATTFAMFRAFWPGVADNAEAPETLREISRLNSALPKLVVSDSLPQTIAGAWSDTEVVRRAAAHERIAALRQSQGADILVFGSHVLWNDLLAAGLVDEVQVLVGNVLLGTGVPAFEHSGQASLRRLDMRTFEGSDTVLLRYGVGAATA
jgi:dihydrofolate reductase